MILTIGRPTRDSRRMRANSAAADAARRSRGARGLPWLPEEVVVVPVQMPTKNEHRAPQTRPRAITPTQSAERRAAARRHQAFAPGPTDWRRVAHKVLLACGIVAPLVYLASDVIAGMRWEGYSFRDQTISELNAIGAPTRALTIALGLAGYAFLVAVGIGVWRSAAVNRRLRLVGGALVVIGVLSVWAVPFASMHVREAEESLTDTLHLVGGAIVLPLLLVIIGFGAAVFGKRYRLYSIATIAVMLAFGVWAGLDGAAVTDNLATPWVGVKERVSVYAYQLWLVVFAIAFLRRHRAAGAGRGEEMPTNVIPFALTRKEGEAR